jgi:hypothetical protein
LNARTPHSSFGSVASVPPRDLMPLAIWSMFWSVYQ